MKIIKPLLLLFFIAASILFTNTTKAQQVSVSFSVFQNELSPYGRWVNNARFGQVWVYGDRSFRPYGTNGHWDYTNYGWSWVSDFEWGWAPFHYGRWEEDPEYGWVWIPGYEWASAWVSWSRYNDYYGWAPLGYGLGLSVSFNSIPYNRWNFMPGRYMGTPDCYRHYVAPQNNYYFRNAVVINNYYSGREGRFTRGPERHEVERFTNNRIEERHIDYRDRLVNRNTSFENGNRNSGGYNNGRWNNGQNNYNSPAGNNPSGNNTTQNFPGRNNRFDNGNQSGNRDNFPGRQQQVNNNNQNNTYGRQPVQQQNNRPGWNQNDRQPAQQQQNHPPPRQQQQPAQQQPNPAWQQQNAPRTMQRRDFPSQEERRMERQPSGNNNGGGGFAQPRVMQQQPQQPQQHAAGNEGGRRHERN